MAKGKTGKKVAKHPPHVLENRKELAPKLEQAKFLQYREKIYNIQNIFPVRHAGDQLFMAVLFWYLVKLDVSIVQCIEQQCIQAPLFRKYHNNTDMANAQVKQRFFKKMQTCKPTLVYSCTLYTVYTVNPLQRKVNLKYIKDFFFLRILIRIYWQILLKQCQVRTLKSIKISPFKKKTYFQIFFASSQILSL